MKIKSTHLALAASIAGVFAATSGHAALKLEFDDGDLIMGFQRVGGGSVLMVNLGASTTYRDATSNMLNIANINTQLETVNGGTGWFDNTNLFFGIAGMRSGENTDDSGTNTGAFGTLDPNRTAYYTRTRAAVGTNGEENSNQGNFTAGSATSIFTMGTNFDTNETAGTGIYERATSFGAQWEDYNLMSGLNQGTAFSTFTAGIQFRFTGTSYGTVSGISGLGAIEGAVDLWRDIQFPSGTNAPTYEGTFVIDSAGSVSYIAAVPEPSSALLLGSATLLGGFIRRRRNA